MSPKTKLNPLELMERIPSRWTPPTPLADEDLLANGLLCVLVRRLTQAQAEATVKALRARYPDWNEPRISQVQEIAESVKSRSAELCQQVARDIREYLQEIFQKNHGFDLEFLREDDAAGGKFIASLEFLGMAAGHYLLWLASDGQLPVSTGIFRVLDRLGVMSRTSSIKKARAALEPLVPKERAMDFGVAYGQVVERWCDSRKPICWECPLVEDCAHGRKVRRDWQQQQKRLEAQRKREEARLEVQRKKDEARMKREAERERKRQEAEARRKTQELQRRERERRQGEARSKKAGTRSGSKKKGKESASVPRPPRSSGGMEGAPAKTKSGAKKPKAKAGSSGTASRRKATTESKKSTTRSGTRKPTAGKPARSSAAGTSKKSGTKTRPAKKPKSSTPKAPKSGGTRAKKATTAAKKKTTRRRAR